MKEPIEFTDRERFILSYYRDPQLSSWSRDLVLAGICLAASVLFVVLYWREHVLAWGLIGYGILVWRLISDLRPGWEFTEDLRSVICRYDAKVRALAEGKV